MFSRPFLFLVLLGSSFLMAGCAPKIANRGQLLDPDKFALVQEGVSTREDVAMKLGSPTIVGAFNENVWYYFGRSTEQTSFFDPDVTKQQAIAIHFDDKGVMTKRAVLNPSDARDITPDPGRTPTYGHETTFIEQLLGNLGRPMGASEKK